MSALMTDPILPPSSFLPASTAVPQVRPLPDGRPPSQTWSSSCACDTTAEVLPQSRPDGPLPPLRDRRTAPNQPTLALAATEPLLSAPPRPSGHRVHVVRQPSDPRPSSLLPDPRPWSASLALAVAETLQGRRPVGQLSRWVDERVLATVTVGQRRRRPQRSAPAAPLRPPVLRSVHLQFPQPEAVEVSAHVQIDGRSTAFAFRLEAWCDRWLCTALELGPAAL